MKGNWSALGRTSEKKGKSVEVHILEETQENPRILLPQQNAT